MAPPDPSHGWDAVAARWESTRSPTIGVQTVRTWAQTLPPGASVLDLGCGSGVPLAAALVADGFRVAGLDAAPRMVAAFHTRFPEADVACEPVETSAFFGRTFDAVLAVGLVFLLPAAAQRALFPRLAAALRPGGALLFSAPPIATTWPDACTGRPSVSLGDAAYRAALATSGFAVVGTYLDEGANHYYAARRLPTP